MKCPDFDVFAKYIAELDQSVIIDRDKDKPLRLNVWETTAKSIKDLFNGIKGDAAEIIPDKKASQYTLSKIDNALGRITQSTANAAEFKTKILGDDANIELSIALHEVMESVKGEADKARNNSISVDSITAGVVLPALPLARIAASVGRKIAFQKGYRFQAQEKTPFQPADTAADIEFLYYSIGLTAIRKLSEPNLGYLKINDNVATIKDYIEGNELNSDFPSVGRITTETELIQSVSLNEKKLGVKAGTPEADYFLNRAASDLTNRKLGVITDMLGAVRQATQASTIVTPDTDTDISKMTDAEIDAELRSWDDPNAPLDEKTHNVRKQLYKNPLYVHNTLHGFFQMLSAEVDSTGLSATKILKDGFGRHQDVVNSLFGIKQSDEYSIDKKESVKGQNLSKTTPIDDLAENYSAIQNGSEEAVGLHLPMKSGRNKRLYYRNSVLNPHASKQSRYMLTAGEKTINTKGDHFNRLIYGMKDALGQKDRFSFSDFTTASGSDLDVALVAFTKFENAKNLNGKMKQLAKLTDTFPGIDYVTILTVLKAVDDVRSPDTDGNITTQFTVSADATASGGTLTFMQALGTNPAVAKFMERIGFLNTENGEKVEIPLNDLYGLLSETIDKFINGEEIENLTVQDEGLELKGSRLLIKQTLDMLFTNKKGETNTRELSKDPTLTFVYGQGPKGSEQTIARSLADRIIDSVSDQNTRDYLAVLLKDDVYKTLDPAVINGRKGEYDKIVKALIDQELPIQIYDLMDAAINKEYLQEYHQRSEDIFALLKRIPADIVKKYGIKVLSAGAVMSGVKTSLEDLTNYGMPLSKMFEVSNHMPLRDAMVLTREQKLQKTVMDVSTIHGIDAAQLYHALDNVMSGEGVVVVHDDVRGSVQTVSDMETEYTAKTEQIAMNYDIHQKIMEAIAVYAPDVAKRSDFVKLKKKIDTNVKDKQKLIADRFNHETNALIGDGNAATDFAGETPKVAPKLKVKLKPKKASDPTPKTEKETAHEARQRRLNDVINRAEAEDDSLFISDTETEPETTLSFRTPEKELKNFVTKVGNASPLAKRFFDAARTIGSSEDIDKDSDSTSAVFLLDDTNARANDFFSPTSDTVGISGRDKLGTKIGHKLDLDNAEELAEQVLVVEHEIVHAYTVPLINKIMSSKGTQTESKNLSYIENAMRQLLRLLGDNKLDNLSRRAKSRVDYIKAQKSDHSSLAEFIAIMSAEEDVANEIYKAIAGKVPEKTLRSRIAAFIEGVKQTLLEITYGDFLRDVDAELLQSALLQTIQTGISFREEKSELFYDSLNKDSRIFGIGPDTPVDEQVEKAASMRYLNHAVASVINSKLERKGKQISLRLHELLKDKFPLYMDVANKLNGIYEDSPALNELMHTITGNNVNKTKKANLLALMASIEAQQTEVRDQQLAAFNRVLKPLSDKEKDTVGKFVTRLPLHDYFILADDITTEQGIDSEVQALEKKLKEMHKESAIADVDALIDWHVKEDDPDNNYPSGELYNLDAQYPLGKSELGETVRKLLALKSIQEIGAKDFEKFLEHKELVELIKDNSIANRVSTLNNGGASLLNDSLVPDYYAENMDVEAIEFGDLSKYQDEEASGWKILRKPSKNDLGIVYREVIDSSYLNGAFTDIKLSSSDIDLYGNKAKYRGVVNTQNDGHKLLLTKTEKATLGRIDDFSQGLVRGAAHSMAIQDSQIIRDGLIKEETRFTLNDENDEKLLGMLKADNVDDPWFIKLKDGMNYSELDPKIRAKYKEVKGKASNVRGFNDEVDLVRKDIAHWLLGGSASSVFKNPKMKWAVRIVKDLVAGAKIGMVVLNPIKIANDNLSNVSYLGVMGVDPIFMAKNYKAITEEYAEYRDLQSQIIQLKVKLTGNPNSEKVKKQVKSLQDRVKTNGVGDLHEKGFINSLGSDLVSRNADTLSGLQADMHKALEYLLINKKGNKNLVSHFILRLQDIGFHGEDFLTYVGGIAGKTKMGKGAEKQLDQVVQRLDDIRTEEDIINYVSQYTTSPSSEVVRMGSNMTDLTDVLAKETLYRHLTQNENLDPEAARIRVLDSFPDYKENMPLAIKQLSDVGILMFPSFWLRIQKAIYRMARDKPINLGAEVMLQYALDSDVNTILDSNIINKSESFGGFLHTPFESIGVGSVLPTHLF